jgi:hypothetical protein
LDFAFAFAFAFAVAFAFAIKFVILSEANGSLDLTERKARRR